jgi:hypothetical protein
MVLGVFSPLTVRWEVHWKESAENASTVIGKSCLNRPGFRGGQLV